MWCLWLDSQLDEFKQQVCDVSGLTRSLTSSNNRYVMSLVWLTALEVQTTGMWCLLLDSQLDEFKQQVCDVSGLTRSLTSSNNRYVMSLAWLAAWRVQTTDVWCLLLDSQLDKFKQQVCDVSGLTHSSRSSNNRYVMSLAWLTARQVQTTGMCCGWPATSLLSWMLRLMLFFKTMSCHMVNLLTNVTGFTCTSHFTRQGTDCNNEWVKC